MYDYLIQNGKIVQFCSYYDYEWFDRDDDYIKLNIYQGKIHLNIVRDNTDIYICINGNKMEIDCEYIDKKTWYINDDSNKLLGIDDDYEGNMNYYDDLLLKLYDSIMKLIDTNLNKIDLFKSTHVG